jgi:N-methylhydantoinase A
VRLAIDTGGTFTDLVVEGEDGYYAIHKAATVPADPIQGILDVLEVAATERGISREAFLADARVLIHGTTHTLNAVLTGATAKTAFLTTAGHPDVLVLREGGRSDIFDLSLPYPAPYVPRSLTFEIPERVGAAGEVVEPLDESAVAGIIARLRDLEVEAAGVCFLWSIVNPVHELRVGELLREGLPDLHVTLSHQLNPCLREYRRASSTCIDASLKPVAGSYLDDLQRRLGAAGFTGRLLIVTSSGGALDAEDVAAAPIHSLHSGPAMAPVAGRFFAQEEATRGTAIVADTGGTSYDVSVVRNGQILWTRETWIGRPFFGHMTGFPSVDVRSVGAGGGSIAWVDAAGLLHVGPESAGADPGPACYGRGGTQPTVTDAAVALGIIDPAYFLGGHTRLDQQLAVDALEKHVATPLGLDPIGAAAAVMRVTTELMVSAIEEITIHQGIDPRESVLVGGGGAAGLNAVAIARRLRCPEVIVPLAGPVLSAAGALISDLTRTFELPLRTTDQTFAYDAVNAALDELDRRCDAFIDGPGAGALSSDISFSVEARYPHQVWEIEVALPASRLRSADDLAALCAGFHRKHRDVFAIADESSVIEFESWHARASCHIGTPSLGRIATDREPQPPVSREIHLAQGGTVQADVWRLDSMPVDQTLEGPAIVQTPTTTVVAEPGTAFRLLSSGTLQLHPDAYVAENVDAREQITESRS